MALDAPIFTKLSHPIQFSRHCLYRVWRESDKKVESILRARVKYAFHVADFHGTPNCSTTVHKFYPNRKKNLENGGNYYLHL